MRHSAVRNWPLKVSSDLSWRRSDASGLTWVLATAAVATTAAALALPLASCLLCLPLVLPAALPPFALLPWLAACSPCLDLAPLFALADALAWCLWVLAPAGATVRLASITASAILVLIIVCSLVIVWARR